MDTSRRSFFRRILPLAAAVPVAVIEPGVKAYEMKPEKKYLVMCDPLLVSIPHMRYLDEHLNKEIDATVIWANDEAVKLYEIE